MAAASGGSPGFMDPVALRATAIEHASAGRQVVARKMFERLHLMDETDVRRLNDLGVALMREGFTMRHGGELEREYRHTLVRSMACFEQCIEHGDDSTKICARNRADLLDGSFNPASATAASDREGRVQCSGKSSRVPWRASTPPLPHQPPRSGPPPQPPPDYVALPLAPLPARHRDLGRSPALLVERALELINTQPPNATAEALQLLEHATLVSRGASRQQCEAIRCLNALMASSRAEGVESEQQLLVTLTATAHHAEQMRLVANLPEVDPQHKAWILQQAAGYQKLAKRGPRAHGGWLYDRTEWLPSVGDSLGRLVHLPKVRVDGPVLGAGLGTARARLEAHAAFEREDIAVVDGALSDGALEALRRCCAEATVRARRQGAPPRPTDTRAFGRDRAA